MSTFIETYSPPRNDVVYGNQGPREEYVLDYIKNLWGQQTTEVQSQYNKEDDDVPEDFLGEVYTTLENTGIYMNSYNKPITDGNFANMNNVILAEPQFDRIRNYLTQLNSTRYGVGHVKNASMASLSKGNSNLARAPAHLISSAQKRELAMLLAIRRGCKYAITHISGPQTQARIHYVLDGIIMAAVVEKRTYGLFSGNPGVPITTSELRYMFRQWHDLRGAYHEGRILFYRGKNTCRAPWYDSANLWLPYAQHLIDKLDLGKKGQYAKQIEAFNDHRVVNPTMALNVFFSIKTAREA